MRAKIISEMERLAGERLTPALREEIADRTIKIMEDHNRSVAIAAVEAVKKTIVQESVQAAAKEPGGS